MKLKNVLAYCLIKNTKMIQELLEQDIQEITQDTRQVKQGSLFIAIKGAHFDGHDLVAEAIKAGALAVVVERVPEDTSLPFVLVSDTAKAAAQIANAFYQNPSGKLQVVGVTGTNGKTTITHLVDQIASQLGRKTGIIGTMYNKVNQEVIPTVNTTPDSITLQNLLSQMAVKEVDVAALEVSSHGLSLGRAWGVDFDVAAFTNLTQDHLDFHHTMEEYFYAKSLLFSQLGNTYSDKKKLAVINRDDTYGNRLVHMTSANVLTYGCQGKGDIQGSDIVITSTGTQFKLRYQGEDYAIQTQLVGLFNVYNLLAVIGISIGLGYNLEEVIKIIPLIEPTSGRFQLVDNAKKVAAVVDYAHTPDGLENVLETSQDITDKHIYCVVGCGGDRDKTKRPIMADIAVKYADTAIFTSDNPRTEEPEAILQDMVAHLEVTNYLVEVDRKKAIELALDMAEEGDLVLVAGKGHETYQIIGEEKSHFDDREIISQYLVKE